MVSRCVCHRVEFSEIKRLAQEGLSIAEISERTKCCTGCGLCRAYVYVVLTTGATSIPVLSRGASAEYDARLGAMLAGGGAPGGPGAAGGSSGGGDGSKA